MPSDLALLPDGALECVMLHVVVRDLASLAITCWALHAFVARQPDRVWRRALGKDPGQRLALQASC